MKGRGSRPGCGGTEEGRRYWPRNQAMWQTAGVRMRLHQRLRHGWGVWRDIAALAGLIDFLRYGWWVIPSALGSAGVITSAVAFAYGWLNAMWFVLFALVAVLVAALPNLLIWRSLRTRGAHGSGPVFSPGEQLVLVEPTDGAVVGPNFTVRGYARTFEGNVVIEDLQANGWQAVGVTVAAMMEGLYPFSIEVDLSPGKHRIRVGDESAGTGWEGVEIDVHVAERLLENGADRGKLSDKIEPRVFGVGMNHVQVWGLDREGSYHRIQSDVIQLLERIKAFEDGGKRALTAEVIQGESGLGLPMHTVQEMAETIGLLLTNLDLDKSEWYVELTDKGRALLQAIARFSEESRHSL